MLKRYETLFALNQRLLDIFVLGLSCLLAYHLRFTVMEGGQPGLGLFFIKIFPILALMTTAFFAKEGLYKSQRFNSRANEIMATVRANSYSFITFVILLYFFFQDKVSRITLLYYWIFSTLFLIVARMMVRNFLRYLRRQGKNLRHIVLVGNGPQLKSYVQSVREFKDAGIEIKAWIDSEGEASEFGIKIPKETDIEEIKKNYAPDAIVIGYKGADFAKADTLIKNHYNDLVPLQILPDITYSLIGHEISEFAGLPLITLNSPRITFMSAFIKRAFDFSATLFGVVLISPLLLLLALLVKITSRGPILYGQERMGLDGKSFYMWKFRSMRVDAEVKSGAVWAVEDDPRRTPIGKFLRSSSLDELPQLFNVLLGDMSLVGPRPERPVFVEEFRHKIPNYMLRHTMKAGMTGWAQINGWRGNTSLEKRIECDIYYIKNWTLWLDVKILFLTFWKGFFNKNAY